MATAAPPRHPVDARLPPRPDLSRATMAVGFIVRPTSFLVQCHERCGDWFTLRPQPDRQVVFTCDPAAVREVFTADPEHLRAGEANVILSGLLGRGSTLLLDGTEHLRHRRLLLPPFHGERMRAHVATMTEVAERHVAAWPRDRTFSVLDSMQAITLEVVARLVFGVDDPRRFERLAGPMRELLGVLTTPRRVMALALLGDRLGRFSPAARLAQRRRAAEALLRAEIDARRCAGPGDATDVLSLLLAARGADDGAALTDAELVDELMTLLVAGHETTASALAWTLERISRDPRVLATLQAEARAGGDAYLDATIKETLRLRPVVPAVVRRLAAPMSIGGWELPAGVHIAPSIYLLHRRADLYPDPLAFRPERFLDRAPGTYEWIPFGGGVRRCLGASFALTEIKAVLQVVLRDAPPAVRPHAAAEGTHRRAITFAPASGGRIRLAR